MTFRAVWEGTRSHVWFLSKASNSTFMATHQLESFTALVKHVGSTMEGLPLARSALGTGYRTVPLVKVLGLVIEFLERVIMGWMGWGLVGWKWGLVHVGSGLVCVGSGSVCVGWKVEGVGWGSMGVGWGPLCVGWRFVVLAVWREGWWRVEGDGDISEGMRLELGIEEGVRVSMCGLGRISEWAWWGTI